MDWSTHQLHVTLHVTLDVTPHATLEVTLHVTLVLDVLDTLSTVLLWFLCAVYIPKSSLSDFNYPLLPNSVPSWSVPVYSILVPAVCMVLHSVVLRCVSCTYLRCI